MHRTAICCAGCALRLLCAAFATCCACYVLRLLRAALATCCDAVFCDAVFCVSIYILCAIRHYMPCLLRAALAACCAGYVLLLPCAGYVLRWLCVVAAVCCAGICCTAAVCFIYIYTVHAVYFVSIYTVYNSSLYAVLLYASSIYILCAEKVVSALESGRKFTRVYRKSRLRTKKRQKLYSCAQFMPFPNQIPTETVQPCKVQVACAAKKNRGRCALALPPPKTLRFSSIFNSIFHISNCQ